MENVSEMPRFLKPKEVAEILRVSPATVIRYAVNKTIPAKKLGFCWRFERKEIERWMSSDVESSRGEDESERALQTGTD